MAQVQAASNAPAVSERKRRIHERYEWLHILNDFLLAAWFLVGSVLFFYADMAHPAIWLFVAGSAQMMLGPLIRTAHKLHIRLVDRVEREFDLRDNIDF